MSSPKQASLFVFTDWHLQADKGKRRPENWPPFGKANPPNTRSLSEIVKDIHSLRDRLLPRDFPAEEKVELKPTGGGPELIDSKGEPRWDLIWGVMVDRDAVGANSTKLISMGVRLNDSAKRRKSVVELFVTPRGDQQTPSELKRYEDSFSVKMVDSYDEFLAVVAVLLVQSAQNLDPIVVKFTNGRYSS
jgi:hypothetical protein